MQIPNLREWETVSLSELCTLISRGSAPTYVDDSPVLAIGQRCVQDDGFDVTMARPHDRRLQNRVLRAERGDVLLNSTGTGTIGRSCVFNEEGDFVVDSHVTVLRVNPSRVEPVWLNALLRSPWGQQHLESQCFTGSTNQVELSRSQLSSTKVPVPPIKEQRRIAEILDALDAQVAAEHATLERLITVRDAFLSSEIRKSWPSRVALGEVAIVSSGSTPSRANAAFWDSGTIPWVKTSEVSFAEIWETEESVTQLAVKATRLKIYEPGTVLVAMYGEGVTRGRSAVLRTSATVNQACAAISPRRDVLLPDFLYQDLRYRYDEIRDLGQGSNQSNLNSRLLLAFPVTLPSIEEQRKIVESAHLFTRRITDVRSSIEKLRVLRQGLAEDLLTGWVRV
ncbi:restriction endonuclease subunit S [Actinomadura meyerae]|nr:restriction endonuclease subunit S [Actinomadura meyerae]